MCVRVFGGFCDRSQREEWKRSMETLQKDTIQEAVVVIKSQGNNQCEGEASMTTSTQSDQARAQGQTFNFAKKLAPLFVEEVAARLSELETSEHGKILQQFNLLEIFRDGCDSVVSRLRTPSEEPTTQEIQPQYQLKFDHQCQALGCTEPNCFLCEANPRRRCTSVFDKKYFKGDILKAKCGAPIRVQLQDMEGKRVTFDSGVMDVIVEMSILDGNKFDHLFPETPVHCDMEALNDCALLMGNEGRPLLTSYDRTANRSDGKVVVQLQNGAANLPDLNVTYSSEALLSGRRPPFRLMVKVTAPGHLPPQTVIPAISDGFVVASGRSRLAQKKCIPSVDDPVGRLEHMGKERVKKLRDLANTARNMGVDLPDGMSPEVSKVGHFRSLALVADKDGQLRQKMLHILKMSEKAWDETRDHALLAVTNDTRMRAWHKEGVEEGLVYMCYLGETDLERPVALLQDGKVILKDRWNAQQRDQVRALQSDARRAWWMDRHPGWMVYPYDTEEFAQNPLLLPSLPPQSPRSMDIDGREPGSCLEDSIASIGGIPLPSISLPSTAPLSHCDSLTENNSLSSIEEDYKQSSRKRPRHDDETGSRMPRQNGIKALGPKPDGTPFSSIASRSSSERFVSPFEHPGQQQSIFSMCEQAHPDPTMQAGLPAESPFSDDKTPKPKIVEQQADKCILKSGRLHDCVPPPESDMTYTPKVRRAWDNFQAHFLNSPSIRNGVVNRNRVGIPDRTHDSNGVLSVAKCAGHPEDIPSINSSTQSSNHQQIISLGSFESLPPSVKSALQDQELIQRVRDGTSSITSAGKPQSTLVDQKEKYQAANTTITDTGGFRTMLESRRGDGGTKSPVPVVSQGIEAITTTVGQTSQSFDSNVQAVEGSQPLDGSNGQSQVLVLGSPNYGNNSQSNMLPYGLVLVPINMTSPLSSVANNITSNAASIEESTEQGQHN